MTVRIDYDDEADVLYASDGRCHVCKTAEKDWEFILQLDKDRKVIGATIIGFDIITFKQMVETPEWKEIPASVQTAIIKKWEELHNEN